VRKRATGERRLFVNGILEVTSIGGTNVLTANPVINIGGNTLNGRYFLGMMDEVRAYNRALSDAEVAALAGAGGYDSWVMTTMPNASAAQTSPNADPDGDHQSNLLEYAFDTDPLTPNGSAFSITRAGDGSVWLSFPRRTGFSGLRYTVLQSSDLVTWSPVAQGDLQETTQPVPGRAFDLVTDRILNVLGQSFFRLEVTPTDP
jgi:hypothetical protein